MKGVKHDAGKTVWSVIPWDSLEPVVHVIMHGAAKYGMDNWRYVNPPTRFLDAAFRHLIAYAKGETLDKDSGLPHLAHVITNLLILQEKEREGP